MTHVTIDDSNKELLQRIIALLSLGLVVAIKEKSITIREAERILFLPRSEDTLLDCKCDEKLLAIISLGTELDDIYSLFPSSFEDECRRLQNKCLQYLKEGEDFPSGLPFWLPRFIQSLRSQ